MEEDVKQHNHPSSDSGATRNLTKTCLDAITDPVSEYTETPRKAAP